MSGFQDILYEGFAKVVVVVVVIVIVVDACLFIHCLFF